MFTGVCGGGRKRWRKWPCGSCGGLLFLLAMFTHPLLAVIPPQATAPALVVVGLIMFSEAAEIDFSDRVTGARLL
ncbi:MAG: hypothetical protein CM15mP84_04420 [Cellvibrionales bacterium]|nr:MAG: hypothetical protein CM15mP84_04420 [Cellvibrionales bacterium]